MLFDSIREYSKNPYKIFGYLGTRGLLNWMDDELYLKLMFRAKMGRKLDLVHPKTYNEKLQWLKLHDRKPEYTIMVDKYRVRDYVKKTIGEEYLIPLLGVWEKAEDIDFDMLPEQFVLKCNHDSGSIVVCTDKSTFDKDAARKKLGEHLKKGTFYYGREWPYKDVKPCIIAEKYMVDSETKELRDYKFFTFGGVPKALFIATDRQNIDKPTAFDFYDMDFNHLDLRHGHPNSDQIIHKPETFEKMKELAEKLSANTPQLRVDFYEVNGKTYFGELTFYHHGGIVPFDPEEWDTTFGSWIPIPDSYGKST